VKSGKLNHIKCALIDDTEYRMRVVDEDDDLNELIASVRRIGIIVPVLLKRQGERYSVMAGHRRFKVASVIGLREVPAYVFDEDVEIGWDAAFAENLYRKDLSPIEEAAAIDDCLSSGGYDTETLARALGRTTAWVIDRRGLCSWPEDVSLAVHLGKLSVAAARNLVKIADLPHRSLLVDYAVENGATARTTAAWFQAWQVGANVSDPGGIEPVEGSPCLPPVIPYTPCVICGRQNEMAHLSYMPVCPECSEIVLVTAREVRKREVAG